MNKKVGYLLVGWLITLLHLGITCSLIIVNPFGWRADDAVLISFGLAIIVIVGVGCIAQGVAQRARGRAALLSDALENQTFRIIGRRSVSEGGVDFTLVLPDDTTRLLHVSREELKELPLVFGDMISTRVTRGGVVQLVSPPVAG